MSMPPDSFNDASRNAGYPLLLGRCAAFVIVALAAVTTHGWLLALADFLLFLALVVAWGLHAMFMTAIRALPRVAPAPADAAAPSLAVIVPVRDEEGGIEATARSLMAQSEPGVEVIVVDDHSTDRTPAILERLAAEFSALRVRQAPELAAGWVGKSHAVWDAAQHTRTAPEWLLFTDGRVRFRPGSLRSLVAHAETRRVDFLSGVLFFDTGSWSEEFVTALSVRGFITSTLPQTLQRPKARWPALGALMLVRSDAYWRAGGHAAHRDHPAEDVMLGWAIKCAGGRLGLCRAMDWVHLRRYSGYGDLRPRMIRLIRQLTQDRGGALGNAVALDGWLLVQALPLALIRIGVMTRAHAPLGLSLTYVALELGLFAVATHSLRQCRAFCGLRWWTPLLHPLAGLLRIWLTLEATVEASRKMPNQWRGRSLATPSAADSAQIARKLNQSPIDSTEEMR